ncbi:hypothetical protein E2562_017391 [Oryza meyeriana var. granulata]|uniref:Uncharacterized protein n=1 Tax=Oryza meyeriana var. granulata TaxID=110450 RepID=A0A6G1D3Z9_9ORYZ|nr:hypothetical protein E2562_017391 [Oryza meyeriana var. granulata]
MTPQTPQLGDSTLANLLYNIIGGATLDVVVPLVFTVIVVPMALLFTKAIRVWEADDGEEAVIM